ncbi:MAG TPA: hypothetical protein VNF51_00835 [Candidatus Paceibacterota bacterium]|nr:hypothetical protein [Candidatus Paceibacterota bacterium]
MRERPFAAVFAMMLIAAFVIPAAFFFAPQRASASTVSCIGGLIGGLGLSAAGTIAGAAGVPIPGLSGVPVTNLSIEGSTGSTAGATIGSCVNDVILIPLARAAIRAMLQQMTASVISWINGNNGTGQPSYVQNLPVYLQSVGDAAALSFIARAATAFNSPFGPAIASSLQTVYAQQTSMAGFYAANQCTLALASPNPAAFLAGDWSQGGIQAWLALTTEDQNNPYTLYQAVQSQVGSNVSQAQINQRQDLLESSGFLSWCGGNSSAASYSVSLRGVSPSAPCTNPDGTPAQVMTPGSIIHDYTQQAVVNSGFQQLISATDLDNALGAIVSTLLNQVLGGSGGLFGSSQSSGSTSSITSQLQSYTSSNVTSTQTASQTAQSILTQLTTYTDAWNTIVATAGTASTSVASLVNVCTTNITAVQTQPQAYTSSNLPTFINAATAQVAAAKTALTAEITPIFSQAQAATSTAATTQAFALQVQSEASGTAGSAGTLASDVATLVTMPPSVTDVSAVQENAQAYGGATASPVGSLTVSGGSLVDQMNLINANATTLQATVCDPNSSLYAIPVSSGG